MRHAPVQPQLAGVPETMLWALHNRAGEARRPDGILRDAEAVAIHAALDYDFVGTFGAEEPSHAVRAAMLDDEIFAFLRAHPRGVVVNLGDGLETQSFRVRDDAGRPFSDALWISVDLPEAIALRERFIRPAPDRIHVACSAADPAWLQAVPADRPVLFTAQGLFMYLPEAQVRAIVVRLAQAFPDASLVFDAIPRWLSRKTRGRGWFKSPRYRTPDMPWGVDAHEVERTLRAWVPDLGPVTHLPWRRFPRGPGRWLYPVLLRTPGLARFAPTLTRVAFRPVSGTMSTNAGPGTRPWQDRS